MPLHTEAKDSTVVHHVEAQDTDVESSRSCPSITYLFPEGGAGLSEYAASVRLPLANVVADKCPTKKMTHRRLLATEFQVWSLTQFYYSVDLSQSRIGVKKCVCVSNKHTIEVCR